MVMLGDGDKCAVMVMGEMQTSLCELVYTESCLCLRGSINPVKNLS